MKQESIERLAQELMEDVIDGNRLDSRYKKAIQKAQEHFFSWLQCKGIHDIRLTGKKDILEYHAVLRQLKSKRSGEILSASTVNSRYHAVCLVFSVLYRNGIMEKNPCHGLELDIRESGVYKRRPMTRAEINEFLENIDTGTPVGLRDRTLFELMYSSGLRVSEATNLRIEDIDFITRQIIVRGKFNRERAVPISKVARDFLLVYLGQRIEQGEGAVFAGNRGMDENIAITSAYISERFRYLLRKYDMDKKEISTHSMRHSTATHLLENGASIRHVQELLGHKSIEATVRYTQLQVDNIKKVYRKYHPRENKLYEAVDEQYMRRFELLQKEAQMMRKKTCKNC